MGKFADRYFGVDPWLVVEDGFDKDYSQVAESIFSIANEKLGIRGYFDEGYSGDSLQGSYINGVYESRELNKGGYKGMLDKTEFMINAVDWLHVRITVNGQKLDLNAVEFDSFKRVLDMKSGELTRSFVWHVDGGADVEFTFRRILSMERLNVGASLISWKTVKGAASVKIIAGLDFSRLHMMMRKNYWEAYGGDAEKDTVKISAQTIGTKQTVFAAAKFSASGEDAGKPKNPALQFVFGGEGRLERVAYIGKTENEDWRGQLGVSYDALLEENKQWWAAHWKLSDIEIDGDDTDQQGIRYCIFQLHQTAHSGKGNVCIGAKGLTGEAYNGNTFWDTEVYCLPFYLFTNPEAADGILRFRYDTLGEAKERARSLDQNGAFYPIATISGRECCDLWQHANTQLQASTAVAYGIWNHAHVTGDDSFRYKEGAEILVEVCRMLASRGGYDGKTGEYGYYGVMGPDEFQIMVSHNTYTNFLGKKTFEFALETLGELRKSDPAAYQALIAKTELRDSEMDGWADMAAKMKILYDDGTKLFEQHLGFYNLPHVDVKEIPVEDFPLYHHWAYDRIYRNDMIKQPDVLMFMFMYGADFTNEQIAANYDFYEPLCIHESCLSPSIHSILALRLGRTEAAYDLFKFASRIDLDNYNRNTPEGLHLASIAGSWMNIVYGFGGLKSDGGTIALYPRLPQEWKRLAFKLVYRGTSVSIVVTRDGVTLKAEQGAAVDVELYGNVVSVTGAGVTVKYEG